MFWRGQNEKEAIHGRADCQRAEANGGRRTAEDIGREIGVSKHTIYGWNKKYGGLSSDDARRLRHLEEENRRGA